MATSCGDVHRGARTARKSAARIDRLQIHSGIYYSPAARARKRRLSAMCSTLTARECALPHRSNQVEGGEPLPLSYNARKNTIPGGETLKTAAVTAADLARSVL